MYAIPILCAVAIASCGASSKTISYSGASPTSIADVSSTGPLLVSISPRIFTLVDTQKDIVNQTIQWILSRNITTRKEKKLASYKIRLWNIRLLKLSLNSSNLSFQNFTNGIYLKVNGVKFLATANLEVEIYSPWRQSMNGNVTVKSVNVTTDAKLNWNNFTINPQFFVKSNVDLKFSSNFIFAQPFKKPLSYIINNKAVKKLVKIVNTKVNPRLDKLKRIVVKYGFGFLIEEPIGWKAQNNTLQIEMKPKGGTPAAGQFVNATKMVCVNGNYVQLIFSLLSSAFSSFRSRREAAAFKLDFTCVEAELKCVGSTCSFCTDIRLTNTRVGTRERIFSCTPRINVMDWVKSNVNHYWTAITNKFQWGGAEPTREEPEKQTQSYFTSFLQWLI